MNTEIVHKGEFTLCGISTRTTNAEEMSGKGRLSQLWQDYFSSSLASRVADPSSQLIYALYTDYESDASGAYTVIVGQDVAAEEVNPADGYQYAKVPEGKYMVFTVPAGPVYEKVAQTWGEIWAYFQNAAEVRTYIGDYECYDSRNADPAEIKIYIGIQ
ncbi:hypothetical protein GCM10010912_31600 [Paenibacillus albidus]|uniref:AraC effector-binding domain-containing protein n=1 Tax=Paenibacillus albidus TaxID=2041023 RepID=A0A917CFT0_9BACL|nr:GyrI-like domain-containing protein [Paenibacillus albidus]GGF84073.1 hypothetical protein GCM10010912_31600 [Paenibacillus albidus]